MLLLDEPCSALDPISTATIEELIVGLRESVAIVIVTHNLQQAFRVADHVAFMHLGELVEYGPSEQVFDRPRQQRTRDYISRGLRVRLRACSRCSRWRSPAVRRPREKSARAGTRGQAARPERRPDRGAERSTAEPHGEGHREHRRCTAPKAPRWWLRCATARPAPLPTVPLLIRCATRDGAPLYTNDTPGLARSLVSLACDPGARRARLGRRPGAAPAAPAGVTAKVGAGTRAGAAAPPLIDVSGVASGRRTRGGARRQGNGANHSAVEQRELVVYALATRGGARSSAAGRAVLPSRPRTRSAPFQIYFIGRRARREARAQRAADESAERPPQRAGAA